MGWLMREDRIVALERRVTLLVETFSGLVAYFGRRPAFRRFGQLEFHQETIAIRKSSGSAAHAIQNRDFRRGLYKTLQAWGIGSRGSRLVPFATFEHELQRLEGPITELEGSVIDAPDLEVGFVSERVWRVLSGLQIADNKATLVPTTKALHHLLPELVVPIDREYTQRFFGWHNPEFQSGQAACFAQAFEVFARVARAVDPEKYVGDGWNTSRTKVIDNAVVGLLLVADELAREKSKSQT